MAYDDKFYEAYERYVQEPGVRERHDRMFDMWEPVSWPYNGNVIDLGCGWSREYLRFGLPYRNYAGFDVHEPRDECSRPATVADYRAPEFVGIVKELGWEPDTFVSLFSTECTAPWHENAALYERLFRELPSLLRGLVTGFYYTRRKGTNPVTEAGDIVSWQTLEPVERTASDVYDEIRVLAEVPSELFGDDVVEVWRMLLRKG